MLWRNWIGGMERLGDMRTMHLFAGAGGGLLADLILGHTPVVAVEWDAYCCQVLRERAEEGWFPGLQVWEGDVRLFDPSDWAGRVDCIHAGFPCTDVSHAGTRAGVGEGTRSGLYREVLRIADVVRPRYVFLENVAAIVNNGLDVVLGDMAARGMDARWICLRASDAGAPHRRDRWWCLCHTDRDSKPDVPVDAEMEDMRGMGADAISERLEGLEQGRSATRPVDGPGNGIDRAWWEIEPDVGRVAHGVASRVDRLKALGNGQVPLQAALAWRILTA